MTCVTRAGAGVDCREAACLGAGKARSQKMLENAAESPASGAPFVGQFLILEHLTILVYFAIFLYSTIHR